MAWGTQQIGQQQWGYYSICGAVDHNTEALDLLPCQYKESVDLRGLISAIIGDYSCITWGVQELEKQCELLKRDRWMNWAYGAQLDGLGEILGLDRFTDDDDDYRAALKLQVVINSSNGNPETIIYVVDQITQCDFLIYDEKYPARVYIYAHNIKQFVMLDRVRDAAPAGVGVTIASSATTDPFVFGYDRDAGGNPYGSELSYGHGFGEIGLPDEGGNFTEIFSEA